MRTGFRYLPLTKKKLQINNNCEEESKERKLDEVDAKMADVLYKIESKQFESDMNKLKEIKREKGKAAAVFKLKEKILGKKKVGQEPAVIKDPETGFEITKAEEIKQVTLNYCVKLLTNREPKEAYRETIEQLERDHEERMKEKVEEDLEELPFDVFMKILNDLKNKPGGKYDFITKSGYNLLSSIFNLFQIIWRSERIPDDWRESLLTQLFKGGQKDFRELDSQRFIHEKNSILKFFQQIVMFYTKPLIYKNMSKFQIACKPGHRPSEHLFVVKSIMALFKEKNKPLIFSSFDLRKFYDSEKLTDCLSELYSCQVKGKLYRLIFNMNKSVKIRVKTPVGVTRSEEVGETVTQGSVEAAPLSAVSIDRGVNVAFEDSETYQLSVTCT